MTDPSISPILPTSANAVNQIRQEAQEEKAMVVASEKSLDEYLDLYEFNPMVQAQRFRELDKLKSDTQKGKLIEKPEGEEKILDVEEVDQAASRFQKNNDELQSKILLILRSRITASDTPEEVLEKVLSMYPEAALADEALDFLIETADPAVLPIVQLAKERLNATRGREIAAGRNMGAQAREFSKEGLGSATSLRSMYRDITGTPREPIKLFEELADKFPYPKLKPAITFLLHSLGSDLKSKGPSIPRPELIRLINETRSLQGILGVFRFFQSRMRLIERQFTSYSLVFPPRLTFEILAKLFIKLLAERYMNPDRIFQTARILGISEETAAQIVIYTQMRDAIKQIAPRYYRSMQHRDELTKAFIDALEKLEDQLEEEEEEERGKKKKPKEKKDEK
jgi:type III secretion protein W